MPHRAADDEEVLILQEVLRGKRSSSYIKEVLKRSAACVGDSQPQRRLEPAMAAFGHHAWRWESAEAARMMNGGTECVAALETAFSHEHMCCGCGRERSGPFFFCAAAEFFFSFLFLLLPLLVLLSYL